MDSTQTTQTTQTAQTEGVKAASGKDVILSARDVRTHFPVGTFFGRTRQVVRAVDGVSLDILRGETFGLVGESGCGKSTLGRTLIRMLEPTSGQVLFDGEDISHVQGKKLLEIHRRMQIVFQDPYLSLDPHMMVRDIIAEPMRVAGRMGAAETDERVAEMLRRVSMHPDDMFKFAYEFSGGQRQRIGIARALSVNPSFILCDEPISALDVSIQAQVVNMLEDLQQDFGLTYLFVAHDLSMVRHISTHIGVMYMGRLVEVATADEVYENPLHPYTRTLISAIPIADPREAREMRRKILAGEVSSPLAGHDEPGFIRRTNIYGPNGPLGPDGKSGPAPWPEEELVEEEPGHFVARPVA